MRENYRFQIELAKRMGNSDSLILKGMITFSFPKKYFNIFYQTQKVSNSLRNIKTISFDCDTHDDINSIPKLIDILSCYNFKVSFACIGRFIEKYPKQHSLIIEMGHEIINHTENHPFNEELNCTERFSLLNIEKQRQEIFNCHVICEKILGYTPKGFRIPHFGIQYTQNIYPILNDLHYLYSSSILATKTSTFGAPYLQNGILEFPITTCPMHPFQAFDTYHAFRSQFTSHKTEADFVNSFNYLNSIQEKNGMYINLYFDPRDIVKFKQVNQLLDNISRTGFVKNYIQLVENVKRDFYH